MSIEDELYEAAMRPKLGSLLKRARDEIISLRAQVAKMKESRTRAEVHAYRMFCKAFEESSTLPKPPAE